MELHQLRCVIAIAEHGTFTDAASALHLSQPALSHAVARLEKELGSRLFHRNSTGARLTAAGEALLTPARRALAEVNSAQTAVQAVAGLLSGQLSVMGVRTAAVETADLVVRFHRRHPGVRLLVEQPTDDRTVVEAVRNARCDIGVIHGTEVPPDLPHVPAGTQELLALFPEGTAPPGESVTVRYLAEVPLIVPLSGTSTRTRHDAFFRNLARRPTIAAECSDHSTAIELVRGGLGATLISGSRHARISTDGVVARRVRPDLSPDLAAIRRPHGSPAAEAFLRMLTT
ncbi:MULTISPECIES: LysR family transcriptional regulator [unclassified Pseudofrankia]|uniref:LysR family transcriptional regulator n=1 Tax=unclassified Pseudofrankia TaxID=2994372 RepID=UPI0008DAA683|nr:MULTISPECIES: LysR substrate-binding domain-containing protein [unclassified Pseudofrankia]MDT3439282.1 LysR substrate-binding domain-containing protein [Pseudofrankia sp. BMG5.37]OHV73965.1 hypothetical protein BCD48_32705 [Pseudofrankia sp. BMG5.36]